MRYDFDVDGLRNRLVAVKTNEHEVNPLSSEESSNHRRNLHRCTALDTDGDAFITHLRCRARSLGVKEEEKIAIVTGPFLYSQPHIAGLIGARLHFWRRSSFRGKTRSGGGISRDSDLSQDDLVAKTSLPSKPWTPQVLESGVWMTDQKDYDMDLEAWPI